MDAAQIWTLIGVVTGIVFGMMTLVGWVFVRVLRAEIGGLTEVMNSKFEIVGVRLDGLAQRIDGLERRLDRVEKRMDGLEREVKDINARELGRAAAG